MHIERSEAVKRIKAALKEKTGKTWSVHGGRGTAWGWLTVEAPKKRRVSHRANPNYVSHQETPDEPWCFEYIDEQGENWYTSLAEREELAKAFGLDKPVHHKGLSISPDNRELYVAKVETFSKESEPKEEKSEILSVQTEMEPNNAATYNNPRLEMIRQVYHERAAIRFFMVEVTKDEARKGAHIIGEYNEFNPWRFKNFVESLPEDASLRMGRELSPVVHVSTSHLWGENLLSKMIELSKVAHLKADEINMENDFCAAFGGTKTKSISRGTSCIPRRKTKMNQRKKKDRK